jgi:inner membrane protein
MQRLLPYRDREDVANLLRFAQGFYTVGNFEGGPVLNIVRFGEIQGWRDTAAPFVFHYFLDDPVRNPLVLQRGRWKGWNGAAWNVFLRRIAGN